MTYLYLHPQPFFRNAILATITTANFHHHSKLYSSLEQAYSAVGPAPAPSQLFLSQTVSRV
jgi:hypothetical protein